MTEHRVLHLQRSNRRASAEHPKKPPHSHVHQEEQHRPIVRTARRVRESEFLRPTGVGEDGRGDFVTCIAEEAGEADAAEGASQPDVCMDIAAAIILVVLVLVPAVVVIALFVWAARKDGQADRAVQARLGIRRRTRLGR